VAGNKGSPGIDGMTVDELPAYLKSNWNEIKLKLESGKYLPAPVKRVEIPKPGNKREKRLLGIPTVLDRFIQQALLQVLQEGYDPTFSQSSYGFRPRRSAHQAILMAQKIQKEGNQIVIDIDLEKFFDKVHHDKLMGKLAKDIKDKSVLKLIRSYLNAGIMSNGIVSTPKQGTPQGGPLSPLLSNIVLDDLDKELEKRGHKFVRYADDCNIYVKSMRAGKRVFKSVCQFIDNELKLSVNKKKSAVDYPSNRKFLGYTFTDSQKIEIAKESIVKFKNKIRKITSGNRRVSFKQVLKELNRSTMGWKNYFILVEHHPPFESLDGWIRRRLRCLIWQEWKGFKTRYNRLMRFGVNERLAKNTASSGKGEWRMSASPALQKAFGVKFFDKAGLKRLHVKI